MGVWTFLLDGALSIFGNAIFLGVTLLAFITIMAFLTNGSKVLIMPLILIFAYGLLQFGLIPLALFGGLLLVVGLIFAITVLNTIFGGG